MQPLNKSERKNGFWWFITLAGILGWIFAICGYNTADYSKNQNNKSKSDADKLPIINQQIDSLNAIVLILNNTLEHALIRSSLDAVNISERVKETDIISGNARKIDFISQSISKVYNNVKPIDNINILKENLLQFQSKLSSVELKCNPCPPGGDCSTVQLLLGQAQDQLKTANNNISNKNTKLTEIGKEVGALKNIDIKTGMLRKNKNEKVKISTQIDAIVLSIQSAINSDNK